MYYPSNVDTSEDEETISCMSKRKYKELEKVEESNDDYF